MEKLRLKTRDIQFFSEKNQQLVCVHSKTAREYARFLEQETWVKSYESCVSLDLANFTHISLVDIRQEYMNESWTTDFVLHYADGHYGIREIVSEKDLQKRAKIEQLELSRRYWAVLDAADWKLVLS